MDTYFPVAACLFFLLGISVGNAEPREQILGTWQLVQVIISPGNSDPRGIPTMKAHYSAEGRLYFISPVGILDEAQSVSYRLEGTKHTVWLEDGKSYFATVSFSNPDTLVVTQQAGDQWHYTRLKGDNATSRKLEPLSVEVIKAKDSSEDTMVQYDTSDYSAQALEKRVIGVWEVIAHRDVSRQEAPPYGYFNDVWVFEPNQVSIISRDLPDEKKPIKLGMYKLKQDVLELSRADGKIARLPVSFNSWGHMVLGFEGHTMLLKLIDKNPTKLMPLPPLKITLLSLHGEDSDL